MPHIVPDLNRLSDTIAQLDDKHQGSGDAWRRGALRGLQPPVRPGTPLDPGSVTRSPT